MKRLLLVLGVLVATLASAQTARRIEKSVVVNAPVAEVWKAWTTPAGLESFFCDHAVVDLRLNGRYELDINPKAPIGHRGSEGCRILSFIPERMLSFTWNAPPSQPMMRLRRTVVVLIFSPDGEGKTKLELSHSGWQTGPEWDETFAYFDEAWGAVLGWCQKRFDGPAPTPKVHSDDSKAPRADEALAGMAKLIGGTWRGEVKGPDGKPFILEFKYRRHPDGVGVVGEGLIGKGRKDVVRIRSSFGWDTQTKSVYYLDSHDSGTVYFGHVAMDKEDIIFGFGPAGGDINAFNARIHFLDANTYKSIIRDNTGKDLDGFSMIRR